jgi:transketolase
LKPVDSDAILASARATGAIITIENHSVLGGLGGLVSEIVTAEYPVPVCRMGFNDQFGLTAKLDFQLKYFGLTVEDIVKNAKKMLNKNR